MQALARYANDPAHAGQIGLQLVLDGKPATKIRWQRPQRILAVAAKVQQQCPDLTLDETAEIVALAIAVEVASRAAKFVRDRIRSAQPAATDAEVDAATADTLRQLSGCKTPRGRARILTDQNAAADRPARCEAGDRTIESAAEDVMKNPRKYLTPRQLRVFKAIQAAPPEMAEGEIAKRLGMSAASFAKSKQRVRLRIIERAGADLM